MGPFAFLPAGLMSAAAIALCGWVSIATALPPEQDLEVSLARDRSCTSMNFLEAQDRARVILGWDGDRVFRSVGGQEMASDMAAVFRIVETHQEKWVPIPIHVTHDVPWRTCVRIVERLRKMGFSIEVHGALRR